MDTTAAAHLRVIEMLTQLARVAADNASVPYSGKPCGAALLLADGRWVEGVRIESGSFPLTIPALQAAYVTAVARGQRDIVAVALNRPFDGSEWSWLADAIGRAPAYLGIGAVAFADSLPDPTEALPLVLDAPPPATAVEGIALARAVAQHAYVPQSAFPVGCVLMGKNVGGEAVLIPGVNVEHEDWTRGLCAERTALAAAVAIGVKELEMGFLSCPKDPSGTPCGACRQLLVEYLPDVPLVMDRGEGRPYVATARALLPSNFSGEVLRA
jgi:cytidine deaminase